MPWECSLISTQHPRVSCSYLLFTHYRLSRESYNSKTKSEDSRAPYQQAGAHLRDLIPSGSRVYFNKKNRPSHLTQGKKILFAEHKRLEPIDRYDVS
jgi:hypothetical protein